MKHHAFPSPNPYLDMQEKRNAYMKHLKALRTPRHIIDNTQPETPSRLINRKNRYIEMQRMIMKTGDENIKLISNCNYSDLKNKYSDNNSPCRSPLCKNTVPKSSRVNDTKSCNNHHKKKQQVLVNEDWITNVVNELANSPSTNLMIKKPKSKKTKKEDLPPLSSKEETEEKLQVGLSKEEQEPFYTTENTTLGDAGYKARLETMVNEINGIAD